MRRQGSVGLGRGHVEDALVESERIDPGDDLVSDLIRLHAMERSDLDTQELLSIFQLIVAGHDTTASLIGNSLVALFRNPAQLVELRRRSRRFPRPWRSSSATTHRSPFDISLYRCTADSWRCGDPGR